MNITIEQIIEDFLFLESWEDKYNYILELSSDLFSCQENIRQNEYLISGCVSQIWLKTIENNDPDPLINFCIDTDSQMVKGLACLILLFYQNKKASWIANNHPKNFFETLGLSNNLSRQRSNGLLSLIQKIQKNAQFSYINKNI